MGHLTAPGLFRFYQTIEHGFRRCTAAAALAAVLLWPAALEAAPLVNINVTDGQVRDVLTALAGVGQVSIIVDDGVDGQSDAGKGSGGKDNGAGRITLQLADVPFDQALDLVTRAAGLAYQRQGDVIVVAPPERLSQGFGAIQVFKLQFAQAAELVKTLALTVPEAHVKVDSATNSLVVTGTAQRLAQVQDLVGKLDRAYPQVMLEAQVTAVNKSAMKDLGIAWNWAGVPANVQHDVTTSNGDVTTGAATQYGTAQTERELPGVIQFGRTPEGYPYEFNFQAKINALLARGDAKLLARPRITTIDGQEARILIGERIPVQTETTDSTGHTAISTEYVDAGIKLTFTPRVNGDGQITARVHTEVSDAALVPDIKAYKINTREAETDVRLKDGETMVIGGLIRNDETGTVTKVPFLSDLPLIGSLFRSSTRSNNETEVVIFLTPYIVK